ncbi:MAG: hypothetical protein RLZZ253_1253 [Verrucomicrobiota bacterium]
MPTFVAWWFLCLLLAATPLPASPPDEVARFIAGLSTGDPALAPLCTQADWTAHSSELDAAWSQLEKRQLGPIRSWRSPLLPSEPARPLLYFFSGPDILYAHAFFPEAPTYVLCGIEPVGTLPDIASLNDAQRSAGLRQLRQSLSSVLSWSFFITKNMRTDFEASSFRGTLPILCLFLARHGCSIQSIEPVGLQKDGTLRKSAPPFHGVEIRFQRSSEGGPSPEQTLFYFSTDLSSGPVERSGFLKWCATLGPADALVKSASYLMHTEDFATVRKFLLQNAERILEDDSGIPLRYFDAETWQIRALGAYPGPIELFKQFHQPELESLYRRVYPAPLPFGFGYRWQAPQSTLLLAEKRSAAAAAPSTPVPLLPFRAEGN